jgi:NADPH:quinone reductase-like Zn-dependent oxidoreductase
MRQAAQAVVVDPSVPGKLALKEVALASADRDELTVRVTAISLNRGEVRRAVLQGEAGWRPGWDFVGVVERAAADGGGPAVGKRVVGMLESGAWASRLLAPAHALAELPDGVSDAAAATLPVAGLTALHALRKGGLLLGRKVLVDGATGGVGHLAVQLAAASGALVCAHVRRPEQRAVLAPWCGERVAVGPDLAAAAPLGPFHLVLDSVGGPTLRAALAMLAEQGTCVHFGASDRDEVAFDSRAFFRIGGAQLYGLILFHELRRVEPASEGLALLADLVRRGVLRPQVEVEAPWTEIGEVARRLLDRDFLGKAVLRIAE